MEKLQFSSRDELVGFAKNHYWTAKGLKLKVGRNSSNKRLHLQCFLGGKHYPRPISDPPKRHRVSKLLECPFMIRASYNRMANVWSIYSINETHNHQMPHPASNNRRETRKEAAAAVPVIQSTLTVEDVCEEMRAKLERKMRTLDQRQTTILISNLNKLLAVTAADNNNSDPITEDNLK